MKLLVIGGTRFLGRHLVELALAQGHDLTLMHRGRSAPDLFPQARHLIADRDGDLQLLAQGEWDAVIDTSAYRPGQVRALADALAGRVGHYQLVSTISVYAGFDPLGTNERAPLQTLADPEIQVVTGETYGGLKALCEAAAQVGFAGHCLVSRPGLLVGPHDPTGRFTWWVRRILAGGDVLAPGHPEGPVQFIDARDAAAWMLRQAERRIVGIFNLNGPTDPLRWGEFLQSAVATLNPLARLCWVDESFVLKAGVAPWTELPVWLPSDSFDMHRVDNGAARHAGLHCRPLEQTLHDTAAWVRAGAAPALATGLTPEREQALLAAWRASGARP